MRRRLPSSRPWIQKIISRSTAETLPMPTIWFKCLRRTRLVGLGQVLIVRPCFKILSETPSLMTTTWYVTPTRNPKQYGFPHLVTAYWMLLATYGKRGGTTLVSPPGKSHMRPSLCSVSSAPTPLLTRPATSKWFTLRSTSSRSTKIMTILSSLATPLARPFFSNC